MIEGPGGILKNTCPKQCPKYEPSKRRVTWPNGSWATIYSDEEPDQLRGFSGDSAWLDEFAKFQNPEQTWTTLEFGMREASNDRPRKVVTTTPRPIPILKQIERLPSTVVVTGTSHENRSNLDPRWFADTISRHEATRIGRQEILRTSLRMCLARCGPAPCLIRHGSTAASLTGSGVQAPEHDGILMLPRAVT
jgi:phage terminase large subunit-like protein